MEKFTKRPSSRPLNEINQDRLYQNQSRFDNNIYFSNHAATNNSFKIKNNDDIRPSYRQTTDTNLAHPSTVSYAKPSSISTNSLRKELLQTHRKEATVSFGFLIGAIFFLSISLLLIIITFIFPFWINLSFENYSTTDPNLLLNITNKNKNVSLISKNRTEDRTISFNLGIWEVKMHQELEFYDILTNVRYQNSYPASMLWISSDLNNQIQSFVLKLLDFIQLQNVNIFTIQILEILHLIFTFLTMCFTSFTLCLCTTHKSSLCWYLVCFLLSLIAFFSGLVVLILIVIWQTNPLINLVDSIGNRLFMNKSYGWCFWISVGTNTAILISSILILLYILISTIILFKFDKEKKRRSLKSPFIVAKENETRLPRYEQKTDLNLTSNSTTLSPAHQSRILGTCLSVDQNTSHNPSYIFYTGNGNYRRTSIDLEEIKPEFETTQGFNYSFVSQNRLNPVNEHNYSNVEPAHNEFRFSSYKN
ncbi:unnamed protein product [Brachionus calyciflorus]|uniref:Uncharacterized protein n=1 Tax=Brachionus calyciflorus TaxID=104777 RepID=A0A813U7H7_9BILA|nr:unnamed protein product [Brachionus calyciflorus]